LFTNVGFSRFVQSYTPTLSSELVVRIDLPVMGEKNAEESGLLKSMLDTLPAIGRLELTLHRSQMATTLLNDEVVAMCCLVPG
jgi:hypothetical protein